MLSTDPYDVVIAGCGPAGSVTALTIAKQSDLRVLLVDKKERATQPKVCGGGIAKLWLDHLRVKVPTDCIAAKVRGVRIHCEDACFHFRLDPPAGYILHRERFDAWLLALAYKTGADFKLNLNIRHLLPLSNIKYLVAADGANSTVAKHLGIPLCPPEDIHICLQKVVKLNGVAPDEINIFFGRHFAPKGYAWCFPLGEDVAKVGLGVPLSIGHTQKYYERFLRLHPEYKGNAERVEAALVPTSKPLTPCVYGNVVFVGDAARHSDPFHGGGIANAMIAGRLAGEAIAQESLNLYEKNIERTVNRRNRFRYRLKKILFGLSDKNLRDLLVSAQGFNPQGIDVNWELPRFLSWIFLRNPTLLIKNLWRFFLQ